MQLNPQQQIAYEHLEWPMLIIAWAGSGKTATLTARIQNMVQNKNIPASQILAVTFTNKAALEMKERIWKAIWATYHRNPFKNRGLPMIWTFHSLWIFILKEVFNLFENINIWINKNFIIYDESDKLTLIKNIIKEDLKLDEKKYPARSIASYISNAKNALITEKQYENFVDSHIKEIVKDVYVIYQKKLNENNALDFDDILVKTLDVLKYDNVLDYYQEKYKYLMIDEYQDTNAPQYEIVRLLASKYRNLLVVGDDWQSIYSWRWANMQNILNFKKDYAEAKIVKLEQNYRSTKYIINAANEVIKNNQTAIDKTLFTDNPEWEKITYIDAPSDKIEASTIAKIIKDKHENDNSPYSDNLILYRTNGQSRGLEEALLMSWIPYKVVWGLKFYDRKEIKDLLAYLKIIHNPNEFVNLKRIINTPPRKIWATTFSKVDRISLDFGLSHIELIENIDEVDELNAWAKNALRNFYEIISDLTQESKKMEVFELIDYIMSKIWYLEYLQKDSTKDEYEAKVDNISELKNVASNYNWMDPEEWLSLFLEEISLMTDLENKKNDNSVSDFVTLMTIHTSKWLEYSRVFVTGLEEWLFPSSRSMADMNSLEEERRLMYVALTRAKKELVISKASERFTYWQYLSNPASRFIKEINDEYIEEYKFEIKNNFFSTSVKSYDLWGTTTSSIPFKIRKSKVENNVDDFNIWDKIEHPKFGNWTISSKTWDIAEIYFSGIWTKKMNIKIAPVKKI